MFKMMPPRRPLVKSAYQTFIFLFLNQNICCGYSNENGSFERPNHVLKIMGKKIFTMYNFTLKKVYLELCDDRKFLHFYTIIVYLDLDLCFS